MGSTLRIGGRFNIRKEIRDGYFESFPALYVAESVETAYREFYQIEDKGRTGGLSSRDLALRRPSGFLTAEILGQLGLVFDAGDLKALAPFAKVVSQFKMRVVQRRSFVNGNCRTGNLLTRRMIFVGNCCYRRGAKNRASSTCLQTRKSSFDCFATRATKQFSIPRPRIVCDASRYSPKICGRPIAFWRSPARIRKRCKCVA